MILVAFCYSELAKNLALLRQNLNNSDSLQAGGSPAQNDKKFDVENLYLFCLFLKTF